MNRIITTSTISISVLLTTIFWACTLDAAKIASESGDWFGLSWMPEGAPRPGDQVQIGNGVHVDYNDAGLTRVGRIYLGTSSGTEASSGVLTISNGTLQTASNGSLAVQVGQASNSEGVLYVNGGDLLADNGGWLTVGSGADAEGSVYLTSGSIRTDANNITLGSAEGSTGLLEMSGGVLDIANVFFVGRTNLNHNTGKYIQSGGETTIGGRLRIGNATAAGHRPEGTVRLYGGSTTVAGDIAIANTITGQLGQGELFVGHDANLSITGKAATFILGDQGKLVFILGADDTFNPIDLTAIEESPSFSALEGSRIIVDGAALASNENTSITLMAYSSECAPSIHSQSNVNPEFIGFTPEMDTNLEWTDTGLILTVRPKN